MVPNSPKRRKLDHDLEKSNISVAHQSEPRVDGRDQSHDVSLKVTPGSNTHNGVYGNHTASRESGSAAIHDGSSYKSSLFKLQVDEMLDELRPNYGKRFKPVIDALHKLKASIESIPDKEPQTISNAIKTMRKLKVTIPFPDPKPDTNAAYKLSYSRPTNINVVGSYPLQTMIKTQELSVDVVVTLPESILQEKDYLNYRYFYKRAYFLACIAAGLDRSNWSVEFSLLNGIDLLPILIVKGAVGTAYDFSSAKCVLKIIPAAPENFLAEVKLRPNKNAIRPANIDAEVVVAPNATPFYNATLRAEGNYGQYLKLLHTASKQADGYKDACVLGRIWLRQRGFASTLVKGGFGAFEWAALTAALLQGGGSKGHNVLSTGYSSFQLFKAVIQYLAGTNLIQKPVGFQAPGVEISKSDCPIFYDGPRGVNILFKMTPCSYVSLRGEARLSLDMLSDATFDQFEATFITKKDNVHCNFDSVVAVGSITRPIKSVSQDHLDHQRSFTLRLYEVMKEGLGDRVESIHISGPEPSPWSVSALAPIFHSSLQVGVVFNPDNANRLIDHGPSAEDRKKATKFQNFWGEKAELRRFKDGSILESLVWSGAEKSVFQEVVTHIIDRHIGNQVTFLGDETSQVLPDPVSMQSFTALKEAYRTFEDDLRRLEAMPLQPKSISPIDAQLRFSSIRVPIFSTRQQLRKPAAVNIQFEGSSRWPDDLVAIQRTKIAFLLKIGELLESTASGLSTRLGIENVGRSLANCGFLDVVYPSGAAFRLRIQNDREQVLLERMIKDKSVESRIREQAVASLSEYKKVYLQLPLITQSIATHCTRFPVLSATIRLVKKWFEAHMLADHIPEEVIELLVTKIFMQPYPWRAPSSAGTGLFRTLLYISKWDWRTSPLVVDFGGAMTTKDVSAVNTRVEAWRKIDPAMNRVVLVVASSHDHTGTIFTDGQPSKVIAARMTALARSACAMLRQSEQSLSLKSLFRTSIADFDFVIHLSPDFRGLQRGSKESKDAHFKNLEIQKGGVTDKIGYEPSELLVAELETLYGDSAVFFHDSIANTLIGGLWNPQAASRSFKVNLPYASKPLKAQEDQQEVEIDKSAILSEIARVGGDIVTRIEVKSS